MKGLLKIALGIIFLLALCYIIFYYYSVKSGHNQGNWYYVGARQTNNILSQSKLAILETKPITFSAPKKVSFLQWENGSISRIVVPLTPVASEFFDNDSSAKKLLINSNELQVRLYQVQDVNDSVTACSNVIASSPKKELFPNSSNIKDINHSRGRGKSWEFTHMEDEKTIQDFSEPEISYLYCFPDSTSRIWIMEFYISKSLNQEKYEKIIPDLVNSFSFIN